MLMLQMWPSHRDFHAASQHDETFFFRCCVEKICSLIRHLEYNNIRQKSFQEDCQYKERTIYVSPESTVYIIYLQGPTLVISLIHRCPRLS